MKIQRKIERGLDVWLIPFLHTDNKRNHSCFVDSLLLRKSHRMSHFEFKPQDKQKNRHGTWLLDMIASLSVKVELLWNNFDFMPNFH